ncbi:MAG: RagB/SusD family nutrient uptake outer membrane protein [Candidatus Marinimicrobia bacterium]|nr:RagB/SusD family nutrient uptake outer membrane protein [Candidatus Neomarinimicrobiota bacterium]
MSEKIKIIKIVFLATALLFLFSCSEKFLDTEPRGVLSVENYYQTDDESMAGTLACYDLVQDQQFGIWGGSYLVRNTLSDEVITGGGGRGDQPGYEELNEYRFGPNNPFVTAVYAGCYRIINRCNTIIHYVEPNTESKKINIAEAKCLRALANFELVALWGEYASLVLKLLDPDEYQVAPPEGGEQAFWDAIEEDLQAAIADLPLKSEYALKDKYRVSKGFAQALLGKAYLYQGRYQEAAQMFEEVINSGEYSLIPVETVDDMRDIFRIPQEFGDESLFEVSYTNTTNKDWGSFNWGNNRLNESNINWQLCGPRSDYFIGIENIGMRIGWGFLYPTPNLASVYEEEEGYSGIRYRAFIMSEDTLIAYGVQPTNAAGDYPYGYAGYIRLKYGTWESETGGPVAELNYGTNYRYMRYADVLLMAAEANLFSGNSSKATMYINQVRERASLDPVSQVDFDTIVKERQMELAFEGWRYLDLMRWLKNGKMEVDQVKNILDAVIDKIDELKTKYPQLQYVNRQPWDPRYKLLPIPEQEISVNLKAGRNPDYEQ